MADSRPKRTWLSSHWPWILGIGLLQLGLAIGAFFGGGKWVQTQTGKDPLDLQLAFIGISACLIGIGLAAALRKAFGELEKAGDRIHDALSGHAEVRRLRDDDFHDQFGGAAGIAESYVWIMNMSPDGKYFETDERRQDYFKDLLKKIKKKKSTRYRRLERKTTRSGPWLKELVGKLEGESNASVAILEDSGDEPLGRALSVQVIDGHTAWLVAIEDHNRRGEFRDVEVKDDGFADMMGRYYNRLWEKAVVVLDNGVVTEAGRRLLQ